eukprot:gene7330-9991_t
MNIQNNANHPVNGNAGFHNTHAQVPIVRPTAPNNAIEFVVKPKQDLYLEGIKGKLRRVLQGVPYPCQMQKNQSFSCLFRHYAKHNGLAKEDLVFYFVNELMPDETPEIVHLLAHDEIWVDIRPKVNISTKDVKTNTLSDDMLELINDPIHADVKFITNDGATLLAHKSILSTRCQYFKTRFLTSKNDAQSNSLSTNVNTIITDIIVEKDSKAFGRLLEFIYSNDISSMANLPSDELLLLLELAHDYNIQDLIDFCELRAGELLSIQNITKYISWSSKNNMSSYLKSACYSFVSKNLDEVSRNSIFRTEIDSVPGLALLWYDLVHAQNNNVLIKASKCGAQLDNQSNSLKRKRSITAITSNNQSQSDYDDHDLSLTAPPVMLNSTSDDVNNNNNNSNNNTISSSVVISLGSASTSSL